MRQKATLQPSEAASRGALGLSECATVRQKGPAVRHAAWRRFALSQTLDRTSTNTATNAKHRGKNHRELFLAHLAH